MTIDSKITVQPGDVITVLGPITLPNADGGPSGVAYQRGAVITVTETMLDASRNRFGESFLDDLSDEQQTARWGRPLLAFGDLGASVKWWQADSSSAKLAYDHEMHNASLIADPEERAATVTAIRQKFQGAGLNPSNQTSRKFPTDPYAQQDAR